jgi:hypothetical protein
LKAKWFEIEVPIESRTPEYPDETWWTTEGGLIYEDKTNHGLGYVPDDDASAHIRGEMKWRQSNGRAASRSRRYFVRNELRYMWVLTFAGSMTDRRWVMGQVAELTRRLRRALDGDSFAYWYSPELHPRGHGWHVNFFVPMWVNHGLMATTWGHGYVWVTDFARSPKGPRGEPLGLCRTDREGWRRAAQYGCKYSQKDWSPEHVGRRNHRYEVAQDFAPVKESHWITNENEAEELIAELVSDDDRPRLKRWSSDEAENWDRPPVRTWRW